MPCTEGRLARFCKWKINRPSSVTADVIQSIQPKTSTVQNAMRTPEQIAAQIAATIRHVYARPSTYARPDNIETTLWNFHWAWAIVHETEQHFRDTHIEKLGKFDAASGLFLRYKSDHTDASDDDAQAFALHHWREISAAMNVPLEPAAE